MTLYAQWTANTYTVAYNKNGGSGVMTSGTHTYDATKSLTANAFTRTGYTFTGWNTKADGSGTSYANQANVLNMTSINDDTVTLYAQWTANTYTVLYNSNGGSGTTVPSAHIYGTSKNLTVNGFTRTDCAFAGWATSLGGAVAYADQESVLNMTSVNGDTVILYAVWAVNSYTVAYNSNGGNGGDTYPSIHMMNVESGLTANGFTRTGYTFAGWNTKADGSGTSYANQANVLNMTSINGDTVTLYAQWTANTYTVAYNKNGGSGAMTSGTHTYGATKSLTANAFTRTGYTFTGWNTKADGSGTSYANQANVLNMTSINDDTVTLYAQWTANTYTVIYNKNGGSGTMSSGDHTYGIAKTLTGNAYTRTGFTFAGWNTKADGTGTNYADQQSITNLSSVNGATVTLYAQWTGNAYTVAYDNNGGSGTMASSACVYGTPMALTANAFTRTGYTFAGWNTLANGTGTSYTDQQSVSNLTSVNGATVNLFAKWTANAYTVAYNGNGTGVIGTTVSSTHTYDVAKALTANAFTRTGYTFAGWATSAEGSLAYANHTNVLNLTPDNGATVTLYAQWTANTYTIVYNKNGGSGTMPSGGHTYGIAKTLTSNAYTRTGNTFAGWNTAMDGSGASYADGASVLNLSSVNEATVTLYAQWTANTYTIAYNKNGGNGAMTSGTHTYGVTKSLTVNMFTRTGYTFASWNTAMDGSGTSYANQQSVVNLSTVSGATVTLYAQWSANAYTVAYDNNGGIGTMTSSDHVYDAAKALTPNIFTKTGFAFASWNTKADGTGTSYADQQSVFNLSAVQRRYGYALRAVYDQQLYGHVQGLGRNGSFNAKRCAWFGGNRADAPGTHGIYTRRMGCSVYKHHG